MSRAIDSKVFFGLISEFLDERTTRLVAGAASIAMGRGGVSEAAKVAGLSRPSIYAGVDELKRPEDKSNKPRQRRMGGGRKAVDLDNPELIHALDALIKPYERGDPESPLRWTSKSLRRLSEELKATGYSVSHTTVGRLLETLGYTLQSNKKSHEGGTSPDRDLQFQHINRTSKEFEAEEQPIISVDAKKKELIGNYKNSGREYAPTGTPEEVNVYDFIDPTKGRATPYGVYDIMANEGYVSVGLSHDTATFAVETIDKWWENMGSKRYAHAHSIFITADGGGSNGSRNRLWKAELQKLADKLHLNIFVSHFPPGTSKWNKIEHRLFSAISMNWRAKPLTSLEVIVSLIGATKTSTGLSVKAEINTSEYGLGKGVSDEEMSALNIRRHDFHPEWNYVIMPTNM